MTSHAPSSAPASGITLRSPRAIRLPGWSPAALIVLVTAAGLALFFASLRSVDFTRMNGLGLLSVLPAGAIAGVMVVALAFMLGLALPQARPVALGATLAALVICLDGITAFIEPDPRFPTAYQVAGFVNYISTTGHTAPGLAAYFSWPGFFALVSFVTGAAGTHDMLPLLRVWPMAINLLCLPPLFLIARNLRISWRARWLAGFLFAVGNWVGQDYFSPQAFNYLLYLVFLAILINWFARTGHAQSRYAGPTSLLARLHRRIFGIARPGEPPPGQVSTGQKTFLLALLIPVFALSRTGRQSGELPPRQVSTGQKAFLLALLIAVFTVSATSHQLTPFFMLGACTALVLVRRCTLTGLPVLLGVILAGWISFEAVGYWSGHLSNIFGGIGDLGFNLNTSVSGRLAGSSTTHLLALRARIGLAAIIVGLALLGLLRRRWRGMGDRTLPALLFVPVLMVGLQSYGGEIALRTYLFMLPAAALLAACLFFPDPQSGRPTWRSFALMAGCVLLVPAFFLARYGNEAFEQVPPGELAAANWVYAHDGNGARLLWLSSAPATDVTPQMPWSYEDVNKVVYVPTLAPRDPAKVAGLISALRSAGPGSYLLAAQTQVAALQETASYPPGWGQKLNAAMSASPSVHVAFASNSAVVYTLHWPPGTPHRPLGLSAAGPVLHEGLWNVGGLLVFWLLLALLTTREFVRIVNPAAPLIRSLGVASVPLLVLLLGVIILRFVMLS